MARLFADRAIGAGGAGGTPGSVSAPLAVASTSRSSMPVFVIPTYPIRMVMSRIVRGPKVSGAPSLAKAVSTTASGWPGTVAAA